MQAEAGPERSRMGGLTNLMNRKYLLCIEDRYAAAVMMEWMHRYKPVPMEFRNAREDKGVFGCFVIAIQDKDGNHLAFIEKIAEMTNAKIKIV